MSATTAHDLEVARRQPEYWNPEDEVFWEERGKAVARRNLWISVPALHLSFAVWLLWSAMVVKMGDIGFRFSPDQMFLLAAAPGLSGATLRLPMSFIVPILGGKNVTVAMTALLLLPCIGLGFAIQDPATSFTTFLLLGILAGIGGGNFSASMSNISFFFPKKMAGTALGLNAGLGNLGVSMTQLVTPLIIMLPILGVAQTITKEGVAPQAVYLQNAAFFWVPLIVATTIAAVIGMNNLPIKASMDQQLVIMKRKHTWLMTVLYLMTFGSFIGFSAAFPLLIKVVFGADPSPPNPLAFAFLGPLVGSLVRPVGGWLSDKIGGAKVTHYTTMLMIVAAGCVIYAVGAHSFPLFLAAFMTLFIGTGIGNGSTFQMIPKIFPAAEAGPVLGFSAAIAAYGAFIIPQAFGTAIKATGSPNAAIYAFIAFYVVCLGVNWWYYTRRNAEMPC